MRSKKKMTGQESCTIPKLLGRGNGQGEEVLGYRATNR